jgi:uroporphyrinogen-III synthase
MASLQGRRVLVTRPVHQAHQLTQLITEHGGEPVAFPALEIVALDDNTAIQTQLANLDKFQWLVFISANAVNFALKANGGKIHQPPSLRLIAIGSATAKALRAMEWVPDVIPPDPQTTETLLAMPEMQAVAGQHFLIIRGEGGREVLAQTLQSRGAHVECLAVYKRVMPQPVNTAVLALMAANKLDIITLTSVESLQNLLMMIGTEKRQQLLTIPLVVISDRIQGVALEMGFKQVAVTENPSDAAILATIKNICNRRVEWLN